MAKKSKNVGDELVLTAKAIRRAEKLERTLLKLAALKEPASSIEGLLKALQDGLARLRKEDDTVESEKKRSKKAKDTNGKGAVVVRKATADASAPKPVKRSRKAEPTGEAAKTEPEAASEPQN